MARAWQPFYKEEEKLASGFSRAARFWNKPEQPVFHPPANRKSRDPRHEYYPDNAHYIDSRAYQAQKPFIIRERRTQTFLELCKKNLLTEEISLTMNKLSMLGLLFVLMFLGTVFFLSGFLVAVNVYNAKDDVAQLAQNHDPLASPNHQPNKLPNVGVADGMPMNNGIKSGQPQYLVAPQYATVGGVPMIQQPRVPSHMQAGMVAPDPHASQLISTPPAHKPHEQYQIVSPQGSPSYVTTSSSSSMDTQHVGSQNAYAPSYRTH